MSERVGDTRDILRELMVVVFPPEYVGPVHVQLQQTPGEAPSTADIQLVWGPWVYEQVVTVGEQGVALLFAKTNRGEGEPPLRIITSRPIYISVYTGLPEGPLPVVDSNDGWAKRG